MKILSKNSFEKGIDRENVIKQCIESELHSFIDYQRESFLSFLQYNKKNKLNESLEYLCRNAFNISNPERQFHLKYLRYEVCVDDIEEDDIINYMRHSLTYKARINIFFSCEYDNTKNEFSCVLADVPFTSPRDTFIINGFERIIVPQMVRTKGVHFSKVKNRNNNSDEYFAYIRPEHGGSVNFFVRTVSKRGGSGVFCNVNGVKLPWYVLSSTLFFDNMHNMLNDMFPVKEVVVEHECVSKESFVNYMIQSKYSNIVSIDTLLKYYNEDSSNYLENYFKSIYQPEKVVLPCYSVPLEYEILFENIDIKYYESKSNASKIYNKMRGSVILENSLFFIRRSFLDEKYFSMGKIGRYVTNTKLGLDIQSKGLTFDDICTTLKYLINVKNGSPNCFLDDESSLSDRYVRSIKDMLYSEFRIALISMKQQLFDRIELSLNKRQKSEKWVSTLIQDCINSTNIQRRCNAIFVQNASSQFLEQLNPLSELLHKSKVMSTGDEGLKKEFASFEYRNVQPSFYGRLCCISTPEGPSVGLVNFFALYAKINEMGFVCSPYYRVKKGKIDTSKVVYLDALTESVLKPKIAQYTTNKKDNTIVDNMVLCRVSEDLLFMNRDEVEFIESYNNQFVSISAALIPFLEHNDNTRANMASNMQRQALPLIFPEKPRVQTGIESTVIKQSKYAIYAKEDGVVISADSTGIVVKEKDKERTYKLHNFERSNQNTALGHRAYVRKGHVVSKNDLIADSIASVDGILSLGKDLLVAVMPFYGWNFEDAVVLSDRCIQEDLLTSITINEYVTYVRKTKRGNEKLTKNLPFVKMHEIRHLDNDGIVTIGSFVKGNDILVGKLTPRVSTPLTKTDEKVLRAIFGDKLLDFQNTSLRLPMNSEGVVIDVEKYVPDPSLGIIQDTLQVIKVYVARRAKIEVGDKISGRYGNKNVVSKILPQCDMPYTADGKRIDMIINPLGITSRMNIGQIMEMNCTLANPDSVTFAEAYSDISSKIPSMLEKKGYSRDGKVQLYDGITGEKFEKTVVVGHMYTLKLEHMVNLKFHARSIGPYSLLTQQPVGGKVRFGGQRCGEMELWAMEAYGASSTILEKTTVLSDDHENKQILLRNIMYGKNDFNFGVSNTFNVLLRHLNALLLDVQSISSEEKISNEENKNIKETTVNDDDE